MSITRPTPILSESDRKLLKLLEKILLEGLESKSENSNFKKGHVALSETDAVSLEKLTNDLLESRRFVETYHFVESVTSLDSVDEKRAREIFLNGRKHRGETRVLASTHWDEFCHRLGVSYRRPSISTRPMKASYFRSMEAKLFEILGLNPTTIELIMLALERTEKEIDNIKQEHKALHRGLIKDAFTHPFVSFVGKARELRDRQFSVGRLVGAMTIVSNTSVLFTTRDWSVTGTISTMAGAIIAVSKE